MCKREIKWQTAEMLTIPRCIFLQLFYISRQVSKYSFHICRTWCSRHGFENMLNYSCAPWSWWRDFHRLAWAVGITSRNFSIMSFLHVSKSSWWGEGRACEHLGGEAVGAFTALNDLFHSHIKRKVQSRCSIRIFETCVVYCRTRVERYTEFPVACLVLTCRVFMPCCWAAPLKR